MCKMLCFSIVLRLRRLGKSAPKSGRVRRIGCPRCRQNLHHAVARERFGSQNRQKLAVSEHVWKLSSAKFAPDCGARAIWMSKSLNTFLKLRSTKFAPRCGSDDFSKFKSVKLAPCCGARRSQNR